MSDAYRKTGSAVRWEHDTLVRVNESGWAIEEGELFRCMPERVAEPSSRPAVGETWVLDTVAGIRAAVPAPVNIERLIVSHGIAEHRCGGRVWSDETTRIHLSMTRGNRRALVDLRDFDGSIARIAGALARCGENERDAPARLRLAPNVSAALIPSLIGLAPPNVELWQSAGGVDGKGLPIEEAREQWPNWYRPSYRVRPARGPLNVRVECGVREIEEDRPIAVALLAPVEGLVLRALIEDRKRVYPSTVRVTRIDAVARETTWYPYGGGSFGAEMML
jgi:hypothetical protein